MADVRTYAPKQKAWMIKLHYSDLAELMFQGAQEPEVLAVLRNDQLDRILFELNAEHQSRSTKGE